MKRTAPRSRKRESVRVERRGRDGPASGTSEARGVATLHRAAGNQAVQSHAEDTGVRRTQGPAPDDASEPVDRNRDTDSAVVTGAVSSAVARATETNTVNRRSAPPDTPGVGVEEVSSATVEAKRDRDDVAVVDVRSPAAFRAEHVPGATNVPISRVDQRTGAFRDSSDIVTCCESGRRSRDAARIMWASGVGSGTRVASFAGGMDAWRYETEPGNSGGESNENDRSGPTA